MLKADLKRKIVENQLVRLCVICLCALFTFGGAVNLGFSGFFFATLFLILWIILALFSGQKTITISLIALLAILFLYVQRTKESPIFFPANGKEIVLTQDTCFTYNEGTKKYSAPYEWEDYDSFQYCRGGVNSGSEVKKAKIVPKGTKFLITKTRVSHVDMGEIYSVSGCNGEDCFSISGSKFFQFEDGTKISENHFWQPYFYYPSLLMFWLVFPIMVS
jgi:hypothetical protein